MDKDMPQKVENDRRAFARTLATERGEMPVDGEAVRSSVPSRSARLSS